MSSEEEDSPTNNNQPKLLPKKQFAEDNIEGESEKYVRAQQKKLKQQQYLKDRAKRLYKQQREKNKKDESDKLEQFEMPPEKGKSPLDQKDTIQKISEIGYPLFDDERIQHELTLMNMQNYSVYLPQLMETSTLQDCYKFGIFYLNAYQQFLIDHAQNQILFDEAWQIEKNKEIFIQLSPVMQKLSGTRLAYKLGETLYKFTEIQKQKFPSRIQEIQKTFEHLKLAQMHSYCFANFNENFFKREPERMQITSSFMKNGISKGFKFLERTLENQNIFTFEELAQALNVIQQDLKQIFSDQFESLYDDVYDETESIVNLQKRQKLRQFQSNQDLGLDVENSTKASSDIEKNTNQFAKDLIQFLEIVSPQVHFKIAITDEILKNLKLPAKDTKDSQKILDGIEQNYRILNCIEVIENLPQFQKLILQICQITVDNLQLLEQKHKYIRNKFFVYLCRFYMIFDDKDPLIAVFFSFWEVIGPRLRIFKEDIREITHFLELIEKQDPEFYEFLMQFEELEKIHFDETKLTNNLMFNNVQVNNATPIQKKIAAGKNGVLYRVFEVFKPLSLISFSFQVEQKDVSFAIKYLGGFKTLTPKEQEEYKEGVVIIQGEKVKCDMDPYKGNLLAVKEGLYVVEFSNQYSWFAEKKISFRINILEPTINDFDEENPCLPIRKVLYHRYYEKRSQAEPIHKFLYKGLFQVTNRVIIYISDDIFGVYVTNGDKVDEQWDEEIEVEKEVDDKFKNKSLEVISNIISQKSDPVEVLLIKSVMLEKSEKITADKVQSLLLDQFPNIRVKEKQENVFHLRSFYQFLLHNRIQKRVLNYTFFFNQKCAYHVEKLTDLKLQNLNETILLDEESGDFTTLGDITDDDNKKVVIKQQYFSQVLLNIMLSNLEENIKLYFINFDTYPAYDRHFEKIFKKQFQSVIGEYQCRQYIKIVPNVEIVRLHFNISMDQLV